MLSIEIFIRKSKENQRLLSIHPVESLVMAKLLAAQPWIARGHYAAYFGGPFSLVGPFTWMWYHKVKKVRRVFKLMLTWKFITTETYTYTKRSSPFRLKISELLFFTLGLWSRQNFWQVQPKKLHRPSWQNGCPGQENQKHAATSRPTICYHYCRHCCDCRPLQQQKVLNCYTCSQKSSH